MLSHVRDFDPDFLINNNPDLVNGPPVVNQDGVVLSGNFRTILLKLVYDKNQQKSAVYRWALKKRARYLGLTAGEVDLVKQPILVRLVTSPMAPLELPKIQP